MKERFDFRQHRNLRLAIAGLGRFQQSIGLGQLAGAQRLTPPQRVKRLESGISHGGQPPRMAISV